jgi:hypothetical protein
MYYHCQCECNKHSFKLLKEPIEIANCYCNICKSLSNTDYMSFIKCKKTEINLIDKDIDTDMDTDTDTDINIIKSSDRAYRGYCKYCNNSIFMYYYGSENIWISTNLFKFPYSHIETYDIYKI